MMRSTPAGKACVKRGGVMVLISKGRRVSHPSIASWGRRRGCRLCNRAILCVVVVCASGSMYAYVYETTAWLALRIASIHVAMPPQSSTRWMGLMGRKNLGMVVRAEDEKVSFGTGLEGLSFPVGGVCEEIDA